MAVAQTTGTEAIKTHRRLRDSCWLCHKWSRWELYMWRGKITPIGVIYPAEMRGKLFDVAETHQRRTCERCGLVQDRRVG